MGGHWRGDNATSETVICPLSYETRKPLAGLCGYGYSVAAGALGTFFAPDLVHRIYHLPAVGEGAVEHHADSYEECLGLARTDPAMAVRNTHSLQYFALDVYAYDVALPGEGCTGKEAVEAESSSSSAGAAATATAETPSPAATKMPSTTSSAATVGLADSLCCRFREYELTVSSTGVPYSCRR